MNMPYNKSLDESAIDTYVDHYSNGWPKSSSVPKISSVLAIKLGRIQAVNDIRTGLPFFVLDGLAVSCSLGIAFSVESWLHQELLVSNPIFFPAVLALTWLIQHVHGLYPACGLYHSLEFRRVLRTCLMVIAGIGVGFLLRESRHGFPFFGFASFSASLVFLLSVIRPLARHAFSRFDWWVQSVVVVGASDQAIQMHERLQNSRHEGLRSIGVIYEHSYDENDEQVYDADVFLGPISNLESILVRTRTSRVAIAESNNSVLSEFQNYHGIPHIMLATGLERQPTEKAQLCERDGRVEMHCYHSITCPSALFAKRAMDLILVICLLPIWLPVIVAVSLAIKFCDSGPLFYCQKRVGRFGKSFLAVKFRSMVCNADKDLYQHLQSNPEMQAEWEATHKLKSDPRITSIGVFLRKSSLDELPQLWNVLRGDMSLVGPRPIIDSWDYDRKYIENHPEVFELYQYVRPGITGLWQISGRNTTAYEKRIHCDRLYLHNWSVMMDVFILWRTIKTALLREGAF